MRAGLGLNQLCGDPHPIAALSDAAFEDVAHTQFASHSLHVDSLTLVGEARVASDDEQPADAAERGDDFLDHAVRKVFLLRVAGHVLERQDRD